MTSLTFLGTGNFLAPGRYWNSFVMDRSVLVEPEHVPYLRCFVYLFDRGGRTIGYSGGTRPCPGLDELTAASDALVLECNGPHPPPPAHMDPDSVRSLRQKFPGVPFVLTHLG